MGMDNAKDDILIHSYICSNIREHWMFTVARSIWSTLYTRNVIIFDMSGKLLESTGLHGVILFVYLPGALLQGWSNVGFRLKLS